MENKIHAGMHVLYKLGSSGWLIGTLMKGNAEVNEQGIYIPIVPKDYPDEIHYSEINQIFTDAAEVEDWMKSSLLTKEEYLKVMEDEDFHKSTEVAWVSDGEYYYYPISKFNENWIMKQPFDYILRNS